MEAFIERDGATNRLCYGDTVGNCEGVVLNQNSSVPDGKIKVEVVPEFKLCRSCYLNCSQKITTNSDTSK